MLHLNLDTGEKEKEKSFNYPLGDNFAINTNGDILLSLQKKIESKLLFHLDPASYNSSLNTINDLASGNPIDLNGSITHTSNNGGVLNLTDGDFLQITDDGISRGFNKQEFTLSAWVKDDGASSNTYSIIWSYDAPTHSSPYYSQHFKKLNTNGMYTFSTNNGNAHIGIDDVAYTAPSNQWVFMAVTKDVNNAIKIYNNGVLKRTVVNSNSTTYYNTPVRIGKANFATATFSGMIGEFKFHSETLDSNQIMKEYNDTKTRYGL